MLLNDLMRLGLQEKEAKVYMALLELGEGNIQQISKKSEVKRTTVYDIVESLKRNHLVSSAERGKKTIYSAQDPRKFEERLEDQKYILGKIMPDLLSITNLIEGKPGIRYFEGIEGIKEIYLDTLKYYDQELLAWVSPMAPSAFDMKFLDEYYRPRRVKNKIWVRAIAADDPSIHEYKSMDEVSLRRTKIVKSESYHLDVEINLYGKSKIGIMSFEEKFGLIIDSRKIYATLKNIFELNWNLLN